MCLFLPEYVDPEVMLRSTVTFIICWASAIVCDFFAGTDIQGRILCGIKYA